MKILLILFILINITFCTKTMESSILTLPKDCFNEIMKYVLCSDTMCEDPRQYFRILYRYRFICKLWSRYIAKSTNFYMKLTGLNDIEYTCLRGNLVYLVNAILLKKLQLYRSINSLFPAPDSMVTTMFITPIGYAKYSRSKNDVLTFLDMVNQSGTYTTLDENKIKVLQSMYTPKQQRRIYHCLLVLRLEKEIHDFLFVNTKDVKKVKKLLVSLHKYPYEYGNINARNIFGATYLEQCCKSRKYFPSVRFLCSLSAVEQYLQNRDNAKRVVRACMAHNNDKAFAYIQNLFKRHFYTILPDMVLLFVRVLHDKNKKDSCFLQKQQKSIERWHSLLSLYDFNYKEPHSQDTPLIYLKKNSNNCKGCAQFFLKSNIVV